jgi:anti-sigma B factor antagonist
MNRDGAAAAAVEVDHGAAQTVVAVRGEIDLGNIGLLEAAVEPLLGRLGRHVIIFDLSELHFMDSSAIAVLLRVAASGQTVRLRHPTPVIREVLAVTGLSDVLQVET